MTHLLLVACLLAPSLLAQSFADLVETRNGASPFASILQIEAGAISTIAEDEEPGLGLEDGTSWDARVWYRDEAFGSRRGTIEGYAGRDGLLVSYADGKLISDDTVTRFELRARPWMFYRDGFYRDDRLQKNGFYDGRDWEGYVGFGREAQPGLYVEFGPFYRKLDFSSSRLTPPTFRVPGDFAAFGGRLFLEQSTVKHDRRRGLPQSGYVFTLVGEREWNDSSGAFGADGFRTELPSAVWRARGRLEWYITGSDAACWEVFANGGWHDEKDRLQNTEGQRPLGNQWADAQLRLRLHLRQSLTLTPFVGLQYSRLLREDGFSSDREFFFGAGAEAWWHLSSALSAHAWYSWVDNDNRPSIRVDRDVHGEHMIYAGMVLRFGAARR